MHLDWEQKKNIFRVKDISSCRIELIGVSNQGKKYISAAA